ncbi:uncharacterized protein LOC130148609 isoform X2 [Falco biarmicus]|uniref:uncharacterized protein LOC130148609 isoform X2 n=1 Tax=Falco biarmicus TaxID=345155 RepID=UPI0024BC75F5|nr:uncharacterized protein LOC130148609 isoform X2 [Falco biarmicus]
MSPSGMDPAVPKATLKVLGLCAMLLVLVAAVTVAVAVMVWRSEAVGKLQGCREQAANESRELGNRVAELEQERARLQRAAAAGAQAEDALRQELTQARGDGKKLNASLASCWERAARLEANVTVLGDKVLALRRERAELARDKAALQGELHAPTAAAWGAGLRPHSPPCKEPHAIPPATCPLGTMPSRAGSGLGCGGLGCQGLGCTCDPAVPFILQRSWRRARRRCGGCGSSWRRQQSSSERCRHVGSSARPGRESLKPPCKVLVPCHRLGTPEHLPPQPSPAPPSPCPGPPSPRRPSIVPPGRDTPLTRLRSTRRRDYAAEVDVLRRRMRDRATGRRCPPSRKG